MEKSQNKERYIPYTMSISAIIIAVVALAVSLPRLLWTDKFGKVELGFDYLGVIVALLALMVTLMVGWNIWQTIDAKNSIKEFREKTENYDNDLQNKADSIKEQLQNEFDKKETVLYNHLTSLLYKEILTRQPIANQRHLSLYQFLSMTIDGLTLAKKHNDNVTIVALLENMRNRVGQAKKEQLSEEEISTLLQRLRDIGLSETPDKLISRLQTQLATFNEPKPNYFDEDGPIEEDT